MKTRKTARAVMLDPQDRVLLFDFLLPAGFISDEPRRFWATPGGEIEADEDVREAVAREVREETGIQDLEVGPELWYGSNQLTIKGETVHTLERFFLVRSPSDVLDTTNWTELERKVMLGHRWWRVSDLIAATDTIFPPRFGLLVDRFLSHGTSGPEEIPL